ncbi:MAG: hypothetical protein JOZ39_06365, partial [Chloroflexi bacterium]|nr:hypothetical protein [Chloroflexota bacterium]
DSPEFLPYRLAAREFDIYLAFTFQEKDRHFPATFFHTGCIIAPDGQVILRERMLNASLAQSGGTGHASRLRELYGNDALFPVVETPLGVMGLIVGGDILQPELGRALARRGAEILVHPTGSRETETSRMMGAMRRATAYFNQAYLLCANIGTYEHKAFGEPPPESDEDFLAGLRTTSTWGAFEFCGRSVIADYRGRVLAMCQQAGEAATGAVIDIERLRYERRKRPLLSRVNGPALAREYRRFPGVPNDTEQLADPRSARQLVAKGLRDQSIVVASEAYSAD